MASTATPAPEAQASLGTFGRITGVLFNPKPTFADIARRPSWLAPLVLICLVSMAITAIFGQRVGWRGFMEKQFEKSARVQQMTPEQREQALDRAVKFAPINGYVIYSIVIPFASAFIASAVFLGMFNLLAGAELRYKTCLGIFTYSWMPLFVQSLLGILVLFLKDPATIDLQNLVASNVGAVLSNDSPKWLLALGSSLDLFSFWSIFLLTIGFSAANPKKIKTATAATFVLAAWAFYVLIKVGLAAIF